MLRATLCPALTLICLLALPLRAEEWSRFRGPNGSGVSEARNLPVEWSGEDHDWKISLPGSGCSSPVGWKDHVYVTSADVEKGRRSLIDVDPADGAIRWTAELPLEEYRKHRNNSFASSTPAVDAERVYVLWQGPSASPVIAYDRRGEKVWQIDLGPYLHGQGGAVSPVVVDDMLVIGNDHAKGSFLLAVDARTGETRWRIEREGKRACYSTPCVFRPAGRDPEIIFTHSYEGIVGVDARRGTTNWSIRPFGTFKQRAVASPLIHGDLVIGASGFVTADKNVVAVRIERAGGELVAREVYRVSKMAPHVPTPLIHRGRMYIVTDRGIASCVDASTGASIWKGRLGGDFFSSPVLADGKLYCVNRDGEVSVIAASDRFEILARNSLGESTRATPAIHGGRLYFRTDSHLLSIGGRSNDRPESAERAAEPRLGPLIELIAGTDDALFQLDLLKGMREGLRGRRSLAMPESWSAAYVKLRASANAELRREALALALIFGDAGALDALRETMLDAGAPEEERREALQTLVEKRARGLLADLLNLLDDRGLRAAAIRALAAYDDARIPPAILSRYARLGVREKQDAILALASRATYALALLDAVEKETVARREISAFAARQILGLGDERLLERLREVWGEIRKTGGDKQALLEEYRRRLRPAVLKKANLGQGRVVFDRLCGKCHVLFGEGGRVGPELTGSNRANLNYILENILDPSASIGRDYQLTTAVTVNGRVVPGIIVEETAGSVTFLTENERVVLSRDDILSMEVASVSMMPEGQLDALTLEEVRDLVGYLASDRQVPLPAEPGGTDG